MENKGCPIADDWLDCLANTVPSPNDLVLDLSEETVFLNFKLLTIKEKNYLFDYHLNVYSKIHKYLNKNEKSWLASLI